MRQSKSNVQEPRRLQRQPMRSSTVAAISTRRVASPCSGLVPSQTPIPSASRPRAGRRAAGSRSIGRRGHYAPPRSCSGVVLGRGSDLGDGFRWAFLQSGQSPGHIFPPSARTTSGKIALQPLTANVTSPSIVWTGRWMRFPPMRYRSPIQIVSGEPSVSSSCFSSRLLSPRR